MSQFINILAGVDKGRFSVELDESIREATEAAVKNNGKAELKLTVKIAPMGTDGVVTVDVDLKKKIPAPKKSKPIFFVTDEFQLTRENPKQPELPFKVADGGLANPVLDPEQRVPVAANQ